MNNYKGCFGAVSVFSFDAEACLECNGFFECALESRKTLVAIQGKVDVSECLEHHDAAMKRLVLPSSESAQLSKCTDKKLTFAFESDFCCTCLEYSACSEDTISTLEQNKNINNVRELIARHENGRAVALVELKERDEETARKYSDEEAKAEVRHPLDEYDGTSSNAAPPIPVTPHEKVGLVTTAMKPEPHLIADQSCTSHDELVTSLSQVACLQRKDKDYLMIREEFMRISLALNSYGLLAPIFRDQPRIPFLKKDRQPSHDQLLVDQIVIDCHWLWSRKEPVPAIWPELKLLFQNSTHFDLEAAATIAKRKWSSGFRADDLLTLTPRQQTQLVQLRSKALKDKYRIIVDGHIGHGATKRGRPMLSIVRSAIYAWADENYRIRGQQDIYESLWLARELLDGKPSYDSIGTLAGLRCGKKPLSAKSVSDKLANLDKELLARGLIPGPAVGLSPSRIEE